MNKNFFQVVAILALTSIFAACGGGSGGSSENIVINGTLAQPGVMVSSLGASDIVNDQGAFTLNIDSMSFAGGDALFNFTGAGVETQAVLSDVPGEPAVISVAFELNQDGSISGDSIDMNGNGLGSTGPNVGRLGCPSLGTFVDGGLGSLWKPVSESTGTVVVLMPANYASAGVEVFNSRGEVVATPIRRSCCEHNGGREHVYLNQSSSALAAASPPLIVRFAFPDGTNDCREVPNPQQRYD